MSEINKPQQFWIHKGTSNFCNELDYDIETEKFVKCRPDDFYDIVSTKDTIHSGIHVIELAPMLKMMEEMIDSFDKFSKIRSLPLTDINDSDEEIANQYSSVIDGFIFRSKEIIESYKSFKRENGLE